MFGIVAPWRSSTHVSNCGDPKPPAGSASRSNKAGQANDEFFMMEASGSELGGSLAIRALAIWAMGTFFQWLAVAPIAIGTVRIIGLLRATQDLRLVGSPGESPLDGMQPRTENEFSRLVILVGLPVLLAVLGGWLCSRLGSSLKKHSPWARWMAVSLLAAASVPPLAIFFQAFWGRAIGMAAAACLMTGVPASIAWILSASASDPLFTVEYRKVNRGVPLPFYVLRGPTGVAWKVGLICLGVVAVMIMGILAG
jgi:hypothetical protein